MHESPLARLMTLLAQPKPQLVQLYVITVDGQKMLCIGPALTPKDPDHPYFVENIEFGDILPTHIAMRLLDGSAIEHETVQ